MVGGGTPLDDAWAFGQWAAARRLAERGAVPVGWDELTPEGAARRNGFDAVADWVARER